MAEMKAEGLVDPWSRVAILVTGLVVATAMSRYLTGSIVPTSPADALVFQSGLLFIVLGSAVLEQKFTKPADSVVNSLMGVVSLVTVYGIAPPAAWWTVFAYCAAVFVLALVCTVASNSPQDTGGRRAVAEWTYRPAVTLGKARLLYSLVFLFAVFAFYGIQAQRTALLVIFWGIFMALWPLGVPEFLSQLTRRRKGPDPAGRVVRVDSPNLLRVLLEPGTKWEGDAPMAYCASAEEQFLILPLYRQQGEGQSLGTALFSERLTPPVPGLLPGLVYEVDDSKAPSERELIEELGGTPDSVLVGFVIEESRVGAIRFETWRPDKCREGLLVWCLVGERKVFFQITEGVTREEGLEGERHGYQYAVAAQLGEVDPERGFVKHPWLPTMNTPVFCEGGEFGADIGVVKLGDFVFGRIPGTAIEVAGPFVSAMDHHTAILGVTGAGKTELAFDLIRHTIAAGTKVICIDLTARYETHLAALNGVNLSIQPELAEQLGEALFAVETGQYNAGNEKRALRQFADRLRGDVEGSIEGFLRADHNEQALGVVTLDEISNTKATLFITELFMSCLLRFAREHPEDSPRVLVVVDEAHTVMPEPSTMGLGDYDSRGLVGKIAQIALQGRKYGVGLLVIAQRTATVSKTVLTQCNTIITFSCLDQTSIEFLGHAIGEAHAKALPNLPMLHAVVFGKAVRSQRPLVVQIPFVEAKARAVDV